MTDATQDRAAMLKVSQATIRTAIILLDQEIERCESREYTDVVSALKHIKAVYEHVWKLDE